MTNKKSLILRAKQIADSMQTFSHPWNANSEISGIYMGRTVGLKRTGVNFAVIPAGKESFVYHSHHCEEEWIYILSGRAMPAAGYAYAEIDGEEFEVFPGDFMAFPTPSVAHHLRNVGDENLVYLMRGENLDVEIADFPHLGKRMVRRGDSVEIFDQKDALPFG
ncbi:cupin domain-containing protein [Nostoc flagelliforme FACHB-838]|uniref:Cupin domain-containing protein n=1 Tax=Nostoc flagelliforme FACHB-838 TaxID=2692904 RepID=A0ABR8DSX5_9NOSO|nr:cupin domain-containing protein [Nostoc flagelliforme]MBD2531942.1 cupin domain-containing protein [Nostoc flagelliforme FACHB-838]